jgi:hypothetical protein
MNMNTNLALAGLMSAALMASAAHAQSTGGNDQAAAPDQTQSSASKPGAPAGDAIVTNQSITQWRAPKLVGVGVFGPDDKQIGKIKDVLIDHDGMAQVVVIGVGGFLGLGTKDVGVPFSAIHWQTEGRAMAAEPPPAPVGQMTGTMSGQSGAQPPVRPPVKRTDPAATEANQGYPDKAVINMTLAQIQSAPNFKYAPDPLAELDHSSAGERSKQP